MPEANRARVVRKLREAPEGVGSGDRLRAWAALKDGMTIAQWNEAVKQGAGLAELDPAFLGECVKREDISVEPASAPEARAAVEKAERAEENKAFTRRLYAEVYNEGNIALIDELYAPDVELHIAGILEDPFGPEPIKQLVAMTRMAFPSIHATVDDLVAAEDRVAAQVSFTGAFQGVGMGTSPRANLSWWRRIDVYRIVNGRIVEQWGDRDDFTMLQRLGVAVPAFNDPRPTPREFGRL